MRYDRVDIDGHISFRRAGRMHHLGIGAAHKHRRVLALADDHKITVIVLDAGAVIATNLIQPDKAYWRNQEREPGRWPSSSK